MEDSRNRYRIGMKHLDQPALPSRQCEIWQGQREERSMQWESASISPAAFHAAPDKDCARAGPPSFSRLYSCYIPQPSCPTARPCANGLQRREQARRVHAASARREYTPAFTPPWCGLRVSLRSFLFASVAFLLVPRLPQGDRRRLGSGHGLGRRRRPAAALALALPATLGACSVS